MAARTKSKTALVICIQEIKEDGSSMNLGNQLSEEDVHNLHQAFIADSINNALLLPKIDVKLFYSPHARTRQSVEIIINYLKGRSKGKKKTALEGERLEIAELSAGGWGMKIDESFHRCFDQGYNRVVFIGSRTPTLTCDRLIDALKVLDRTDVVIGPTVEGRYYMIGFTGGYQVVLADFDWWASNIYSQVATHIDKMGLSWEETEVWYAVENPEDVEYLVRDINHFRLTGDEETARETEKALERILNRMV